MIEKLTEQQALELVAYREKMFNHVISTKTNRKKAEKWARRLTADTLVDPSVHWYSSPEEVSGLLCNEKGRLRYFLKDMLLIDLRRTLAISTVDTLTKLINGNIERSIFDSIYDELWEKNNFRLNRYRKNRSLIRSKALLSNAFNDIGWLTTYSYLEKIGIKYNVESSFKLKCYRKLLKHCFAIYVIPGHIVLVDKPIFAIIVESGDLPGGIDEVITKYFSKNTKCMC